MGEFINIIKKIASDLQINVTFLSDDWLTVLEKNGVTHCIQGYKFPLNDHAIGNILDDKGLFYDLMVYKNNPIIEHKVIFKNTPFSLIENYFDEHNEKIIVKGNIGTLGNEVFLVTDKHDLRDKVTLLFQSQFSISLCPFYDIEMEYRIIVLNNEVRLIYGKQRPMVVGDGVHNLEYLAKSFNQTYYSFSKNINFDKEYVPKLSEKVLLNFQFNLSKGAIPFFDIDSHLAKYLSNIALKVAHDAHINFASIDIIKTVDNKFLLMEANSGVMMNNILNQGLIYKDIAYNIYKDAISLMFFK